MAKQVPNDPIVDYPSQAVILDTILVEQTSNKLGNYTPVEPGAPYPKGTHTAAQVSLFDGNEFLGQKASADDEWMQRFFGKAPSTQNIANWEEAFGAEGNAYPNFQRRYLEKRDSYTPRTKGQPLEGLYRINVTATGSEYLVAPTISFTGGTGSGATAIAVLNNSGGVAKITIKTEGTYTVVPTVVITPAVGDPGTGATATASIQPASCVLTKEEVSNNAPAPYGSLYIVVTRLYETLPGPSLTTSRYDPQSNTIITTVKTKKLLSAITEGVAETGADETAVMAVTESEQITDMLGMEIVTIYPRGDSYSEATAVPSTDVLPFQFPMTFDMDMYVDAGVGFATLAFIKRVPHYKLVWWVVDDEEPPLELNGIIDFGQSYELFGQQFGGQVIYDAIPDLPWGGQDFDFPGSDPDFTTYVADWVGGDPRSVLGSVRQDGGKFRWRVEKIFVQYILPRRATISPP